MLLMISLNLSRGPLSHGLTIYLVVVGSQCVGARAGKCVSASIIVKVLAVYSLVAVDVNGCSK